MWWLRAIFKGTSAYFALRREGERSLRSKFEDAEARLKEGEGETKRLREEKEELIEKSQDKSRYTKGNPTKPSTIIVDPMVRSLH